MNSKFAETTSCLQQNGLYKEYYMERIVIINFGAQYNQLIARRVREAGVYRNLRSEERRVGFTASSCRRIPRSKKSKGTVCAVLFCPAGRTVHILKAHEPAPTSCSTSACPCLAFATECSLCAKNSAAKSAPLRRVNTAKHPCISNAAHCLRTCPIQ